MAVHFDGLPAGPPPEGGGFVVLMAVDRYGSEHGPWRYQVTPEAKERGASVDGLKARIEHYMTTGE